MIKTIEERDARQAVLRDIKLLEVFSDGQIANLVDAFELRTYAEDEVMNWD